MRQINNSLKKKVLLKTKKNPSLFLSNNCSSLGEIDSYIDNMAILRIVIGVKQQLIKQQQIHLRTKSQRRKKMERQIRQQGLNTQDRQERNEEIRNSFGNSLNQGRRERGLNGSVEWSNVNHPEVPNEIRPFLIQLEDNNNPNNMTTYQPQHPEYTVINPNNLQVILQPQNPTQIQHATKKEISYEKIIIYGIVWMKEVNGLFDYQEKDKTQKSTIVIEDDVKGCINFIHNIGESFLPKETDTYLLIFKRKDKTIHYKRKILKEIEIPPLRCQYNNESEKESQNEQQFLCALKLVMNKLSNQFTIKVFSLNELSSQVNIIKKTQLVEGLTKLNISISQSVQNIQPSSTTQSSEPYFIIRTLSKTLPSESNGKRLYPGDLIKLGKILFKVVSIDGVSIEDKNTEEDRKALEVTQIDPQLEKEIECKYCLAGKSEQQDNFFLHLCNCKGHIGYVHYNCLTTWTTTKASIETSENLKMFFLEKMKCEVCLKDFPKYFKYQGKIFHLLPMELPQKHMVLVDVSQRQDSIIAIISGNTEKPIMIGRGRAATLRISDITVSRQHATIKRIGDDYYIKDNKSKFGTLVRSSQKQIQQGIEHKKGFQIGNVIFTVQVVTKEVQVIKKAQQIKQNVQQEINIETQNHQRNEEKFQNFQSRENSQHRKNNEKKWNLELEKKQFNEEQENYQQNHNLGEEELEESTRATKRSQKKPGLSSLISPIDENSTKTSSFRRKLVMRPRSRNQQDVSQTNRGMNWQGKRKASPNQERGLPE